MDSVDRDRIGISKQELLTMLEVGGTNGLQDLPLDFFLSFSNFTHKPCVTGTEVLKYGRNALELIWFKVSFLMFCITRTDRDCGAVLADAKLNPFHHTSPFFDA